jgi:spore coat protein JA
MSKTHPHYVPYHVYPSKVKWMVSPLYLYMDFQPMHESQFSPAEALKHGTLWPAWCHPYPSHTVTHPTL